MPERTDDHSGKDAAEAEAGQMKRVERISDAGSINMAVTDEVQRDYDDCPWCGAALDEDGKCGARCAASRRVDRLDGE